MKINGASGLGTTGARPKRGATGGAGFAGHLNEPTRTAQAAQATGPGSVAALLAVQAAGDSLEGRRQAYDRAEGLLKRLDGLRLALLEGRLDDDALKRLAANMEQRADAGDDPDLAELIAEIELRAQVELAKRGLV